MGRHPDLDRLTLSPSLKRIIDEAEDIARQTGAPPHSAHLLLAFFVVDQAAARTLKELDVREDEILDQACVRESEDRSAVRKLLEHAAAIAASCGASKVEALHLLVAMTRSGDALASRALAATRPGAATIRARALALLTGPMQRWAERRPTQLPRRNHLSTPPPRRKQRTETVPPQHVGATGFAPAESASPRPAEQAEALAPPPLPHAAPPVAPAGAPLGPHDLDPEVFPWLTSLGRNLSAEAARERLDPLVGRAREVGQLMDVLGKRKGNNPCLIGEPGVGKTAVVEGLAAHAVAAPEGSRARRWVFVELDVGALMVGTHLRGSFSEKLQGLKEEVEKSDGRVVVFFDEMHTLIGAGSTGEGPLDAANELKSVLARGRFPCIGATTTDEYHRHVESDPALARRFVPIRVEEPQREDAVQMMYQLAPAYADHHQVGYQPEALEAAVDLSLRWITDQRLPDKAIALIDLAGSRAARAGHDEVTRALVGKLVAERAGVPVERVLANDEARLLNLEAELQSRVVGHRTHLTRIAECIRRNAAGFRGTGPQGVFLFLGPTGVGKTETAKALAEILYGPGDNMVRFDMNDFAESHAVSRLIGAPPGYVGYEGGGQLTEAIRRRPGRVVLFDEVEKAHPEVTNVLLTLLDEGRLTDAKGRAFSFSESVVIMTSNAGTSATAAGLGFDPAPVSDRTLEAARRQFAPELWGRIQEHLVFEALDRDLRCRIVERIAARSSARLQRERGLSFSMTPSALRYVVDQSPAELGARPLQHGFRGLVEGPIARKVLEGRLHAGEAVRVESSDRGLRFIIEGGESLSVRPVRS